MSKIGVIFAAWQCEDLLEESLRPWVEARKSRLSGNDWVISIVSVPFAGFPQEPLDRTHEILDGYMKRGEIDFLNKGVDVMWTETQARGMALQDLVSAGCETVVLVDSDEIYDVGQLERIFAFVEARPLVTWFRVSLKNAVFDKHTFLVAPFTPPRIFRTKVRNYQIDRFIEDNDVAYRGTITRDFVSQAHFASMTIPSSIAFVKHFSWLNDSRSRAKQAYQWARWGICDFDWDDSRGGLIWRDGVVPKETARDA